LKLRLAGLRHPTVLRELQNRLPNRQSGVGFHFGNWQKIPFFQTLIGQTSLPGVRAGRKVDAEDAAKKGQETAA
jgi:hypothetical protein